MLTQCLPKYDLDLNLIQAEKCVMELPDQHFHLEWFIMVEQIWLVVLYISIRYLCLKFAVSQIIVLNENPELFNFIRKEYVSMSALGITFFGKVYLF